MRRREFDKAGVRHVLIRGVNWLGDAVMTTPALGALRQAFPGARLALLATPGVAELLRGHPFLDEVLVFERTGRHAGVAGRLRLARELREQGFDLAVLLQNAFDAALIAWLARIPRRIGYATDGRGFLLTHRTPVTGEDRRCHHVDYYLAMLASFGIPPAERRLSLALSPEEEREGGGLLTDAGIGAGEFVVGINPGATYGAAKRWYPERFAAVADALAARWGAKVVLFGGPGEVPIAGAIAAAMTFSACNLAGRLSIRQLMAAIGRCDFFVTNDSGPMHIAAAFDVPLVAIFGPTDHATTSPFSPRARVVREGADCAPCLKRECPSDHRCMAAVTPETVVAAALSLYEEVYPTCGS